MSQLIKRLSAAPTQTDIPRPEYPRPQLVRENWLNLNGQWEFEIDHDGTGEERGLHHGGRYQRHITVPFCPESQLSGIGQTDFMRTVWYRREVTIPEGWRADGRLVMLHCGAVDYEATVWVNGQRAGFHRGGYASFSFDITTWLRAGHNQIVIRAVDDTASPLQPTGKQSMQPESAGIYYTRVTGIWQTVWLEAVPQTYLKSFRLVPDIVRGRVVIQPTLNGRGEGMRLTATAWANGREVGRRHWTADVRGPLVMKLSECHLWQPEQPFLYDLKLTLTKNGQTVDEVDSYFGLREVKIKGKKVLINGRPIFQRLVLDQGYYPQGIYTAPTREDLKKDISLAQAMGFNGARLHQKVFEPWYLTYADQMGYLAWGEYGNYGLDYGETDALPRVFAEWLEVVKRDFNHPAIIGWCPFNETANLQNFELLDTIYNATKVIDPTRPALDTSGWTHCVADADIFDSHNYEQDPARFAQHFEALKRRNRTWQNGLGDHAGWSYELGTWNNGLDFVAAYPGQPYFVSEYGGIGWNPDPANRQAWGYGSWPKTTKEFLQRYRALTETLLHHPKMFGFCYTQLYDVEQEFNGLYTYDRQPKFAPKSIKKVNCQPAVIEQMAQPATSPAAKRASGQQG
ncbi:MAG TPA: glycoside hydrolase family 2 TIM barrel-domain containing protein [Candidatus Saccharimonadales bacterium]|nr:glycoside hydrolase family 2 TIM barrel-domain containing protein [Candidatus Saccharimonadales bacterium]